MKTRPRIVQRELKLRLKRSIRGWNHALENRWGRRSPELTAYHFQLAKCDRRAAWKTSSLIVITHPRLGTSGDYPTYLKRPLIGRLYEYDPMKIKLIQMSLIIAKVQKNGRKVELEDYCQAWKEKIRYWTKSECKENNLKFQRGWLDEFNWLIFDMHKAVMHCALCRAANLPWSSNKLRVNA